MKDKRKNAQRESAAIVGAFGGAALGASFGTLFYGIADFSIAAGMIIGGIVGAYTGWKANFGDGDK